MSAIDHRDNRALRSALAAGTAVWIFASLNATAVAQTAGTASEAQAASAQSQTIEEVVVTARRREEKLQTVPIAISAISGETLTEHTVNSAVDLSKIVPALGTAETNRDIEGYEIRGMSNNNASAQGQSPTITPYFAEVPYPTGDGGGPGRYFDLENVQVLKGPQGTLFGRNATGGAVLFQPAKPTNDFDGYLQAQVGNYSDEEIQGAVNVPIVDDKLMARFAGSQATRDGFTKDILDGKDLDNRDYWAGRFSLTFRPSDDFENYFVADSLYSHTNGTSEVVAAFNPSLRLSTIAGLPLTLSGNGPTVAELEANPGAAFKAGEAAGGFSFFPLSELTQTLQQQAALGPREVAIGNNPLEKYWSWGLTDIARYDLSDDLTFRNIFGYREYKQLARYDDDGTVLPLLSEITPGGWNIDLAQYTEEMQLQGKSLDDSLIWTAGAFGLFQHAGGPNQTVNSQFGSLIYSQNSPTSRSEAIYAQGSYDLGHSVDALEGLKFTAGYRFTWDYRQLNLVQEKTGGVCSAPGADKNCDVSVALHGSQPSWNVGFDYQVTPDTLVYVSARRGFRSGGLNSQSLIANQIEFKPEIVTDVELGIKSDWQIFGMKARSNLEAFHTDYNNKQASEAYTAVINGSTVTTNLIVNAGNVTINGLDGEFTLLPIKSVELNLGWAYNQAKYDNYLVIATGQSVPGETYPYVPQNKLSFRARYTLPTPDDWGNMSVSGTWSYQSHQYLGTFPTDPAYTTIGGSYSTIDLSFDWKNVLGNPVDLSLFVNNLTDTVYRIGGYPLYSVAGFASFFYGEPQMYGARIKYRFGGTKETSAESAAYVPPPPVAPAPAPVARSYMVFFDFNRSDLTPQAVQIVSQAASNAGPSHVTQLTVTGHTDTVGSDAYNMRLSRRRAESVAAQLEKDGVLSSEIEIVAKGKRDLLVPTADGIKEPQNRRVQIVYDGPQS